MTGARVVVFVSDLHLSTRGDAVFDQASWSRFLDSLRGNDVGRLVLLGDSFNLPPPPRRPDHRWRRASTAELDAIFRRYPDVLGALQGWLASGRALDIVSGNHDVAVVDEIIGGHLIDQLAAGEARGEERRPSIHPWLIHEPGVYLAEHGHQHHDINAFASALEPLGQRSLARPPAGLLLERHAMRLALSDTFAARLRAHAALPRDLMRWRRFASRAACEAVDLSSSPDAAGGFADRWELPATFVVAAAAPRSGGLSAIGRRVAGKLARRLVRRARGTGGRGDDYMLAGWRAMAALCAVHGVEAPFLLFGHTHRPRVRRGDGPGATTYLNAGSWSWGDGDQAGGFVRVRVPERDSTGEATAELMHWDGSSARAWGEPLD
jgi:UDP-2,3-diacylglucosamine pyrophosphatase LpxH